MPPQNQTCSSSYNEQSGRQQLIYIPSPFTLSAASYLQQSGDQVCIGAKRKRDEYEFEDNLTSGADVCLSLLHTSVSKLHRTPASSVRGRRRSTSLRRSVLIFNMLNILQNGCPDDNRATWHRANIQNSSCTTGDSERLVSDKSLNNQIQQVERETLPLTSTHNTSIDGDDTADSEMADSVGQFDYEFFKTEITRDMEQDSTPERDSESRNGILFESSWQPAAQVPCLVANHPHSGSSPTKPFLSEELFDLEASLFDFDCLDSYLNISKDSTKDTVSRVTCGHELDLLECDLEYLMRVLVDS